MIALLDRAYGLLVLSASASIVVSFCYGVYLTAKKRTATVFWLILAIALFNLCIHAVLFLIKDAARAEVRVAVNDIRNGKGQLFIDGKPVQHFQSYLKALEELQISAGSHSSTILPCIAVAFRTTHDTVTVELKRDSDRKDEYWVFYPKYKTTTLNRIGKVRGQLWHEWFESNRHR